MQKPIRGIVFDFDGTLVDSLPVTFDAFNHGIVQSGGLPLTPHQIMVHFGLGERSIFAKLIGEAKADAAYVASREYTILHQNRLPLHPGAGDLLAQLASEKVPIAIFTGRGDETTQLILDFHGLRSRFMAIITHDHVSQSKPHPEGLILAAEGMGLAPEEVLMVGDSWSDMKAAHDAGSTGVAATWDHFADRPSLQKESPHFWAHHPSEVWDAWKKLKSL